jgi:hypothetical protein
MLGVVVNPWKDAEQTEDKECLVESASELLEK